MRLAFTTRFPSMMLWLRARSTRLCRHRLLASASNSSRQTWVASSTKNTRRPWVRIAMPLIPILLLNKVALNATVAISRFLQAWELRLRAVDFWGEVAALCYALIITLS